MAEEIDNIITIATKVTSNNGDNPFVIYTPSNRELNGYSIKYFGLINTLRLNSYIGSLTPVELSELDPAATPEEIRAYNQALINQPRKGIELFLRRYDSGTEGYIDVEVGFLAIYPNKPRYMVNLIAHFTDLQLYGVQNGTSIMGKIVDIGYGGLENEDWISINGSVIEKSIFFFNTSDDSVVNVVF